MIEDVEVNLLCSHAGGWCFTNHEGIGINEKCIRRTLILVVGDNTNHGENGYTVCIMERF